MIDSLFQDIRYALRLGARTPGFTAIAVLALAVGLGANTAIFTIVDAVLLERLPFRDSSQLVVIWEESSHRPGRPNTVGPANFLYWRVRASSFEAMAALADTRVNLTGTDRPEELVAQVVTEDFFHILGVPALIGRTFSDEESADPDASVTVLSHTLWLRRFAGDVAIVGRAIQLNGRPMTVIGIMPPDVRLLLKSGSLVGKPTDVWMPYVLPPSAWIPRGRYLSVIARLKPGVPLQTARTEMRAIAAGLTTAFPQFDTGWSALVRPLAEELSGNIRPALLMLAGAVGFVLLIACANVANLLLARGASRRREIAIRTALGATTIRTFRQLLTESLVLGALGGAGGLLVGRWGVALLLASTPAELAGLGHVTLSSRVLGFTALVSVVTAMLCGVAPALEGSRGDVQESLNAGARQAGSGRRHLREALVVAEIALSAVLLVGAGLMVRSLASLRSVNPGFNADHVLTVRVSLPGAAYGEEATRLRFFRDLVARVGTIPGARAAGVISFLPFAGLGAATGFTIVGQPPPPPGQGYVVDVKVCDNGYFRAMDVPLLRGRLFSEREMREKSDVVIISDTMARRYFPGIDPIGQQVSIEMMSPIVPTRIVGVVADVKNVDLTSETRAMSYWPHPQLSMNAMTLTVRTDGDPLAFAPLVEREVRALDKDQPVADVRSMQEWVAKSLAETRFTSLLLTTFAAIALALAAIGVYGVVSYAVSLRTSEIGLRLALGAEARDVLTMIVGSAVRLAAIGLGVGVALALALGRAVTSLLYATRATDPLTFAAVVIVLAAVAVFASYVPARRASRIAPIEALRCQ
ncbi:MAG TPA: ABC transporter permease [Vicinamibacterales bacterium]|jgi:putative ABC transport system permease protein|nr:ABC transporter permease [Vicinamibacterales bacterium]